MRPARPLFFLLLVFCATLVARAQSVRWEPAEGGMASAIVLVFENCEPDGQPSLPAIPGVTVTFAGRNESSQSTFGPGGFNTTRTVALSYLVRGPQNPAVQIPAFTVKTNKGPLRVAPFNVASPTAPLDSVASAKFLPSRPSVWAGEVFGLNYELSASRRTNPQILPTFDWNAAPLVAEDWSKPEVNESIVNGERRVNVGFRTRAIARTANNVKLEAATHLLSIQTGTVGFGFLSQPRMEQVTVTSDQPVIAVRPLPTGAPAAFRGAVGQFKLVSKVVPEKAAVGEPVTWTLELSGTGNWPDVPGLPAREVSNDFQVVQPKAKRTPSDGKLFDVALAEDVVLVPSKAGNYTLGPVSFAYFEPQSGSYQTLTTPRTTLTITAPATSQFSVTPPPGLPGPIPETGNAATANAPATRKPVAAPALPAGIPRDPLPGSAVARRPMSTRAFVIALLAPVAGLFAFWAFLALRRAQATDPLRLRREARDRLAQTLAQLQDATETRRAPLLLAWQHDSAVLWQLTHAAPSARAFIVGGVPSPRSSIVGGVPSPRSSIVGGVPSPRSSDRRSEEDTPAENTSDWATLWAEADRSLYGAKSALPSDWVARAQAALAAKKVPGFKPLRLFLPQNLMPFAAMLAVGLVASTVWMQAAGLSVAAAGTAGFDGGAAYRKADFPTAENAWRAAIEKQPTDWIARHNLSLALEQQERPGEAAAQAAVAFVQNPASPAVRWHFAHTAEKLGTSPASLASFVTPGFLHSLVQLASPANWQRVVLAAIWAAALGLAGLLARAYGRGPRALRWISATVIVAGLTLAGGAYAATLAYGLTAETDAVIVARATTLRSIPTEADTTQKTSPLAAGSLALAEKSFLGWRRLAFENGQTGWVRKGDIVPVWK